MTKIKVVHIVEALGGGVYTYFKNLSHYFGDENISKYIETTIIYSSKRKEIVPENIKKDFSANVTLIEIDMVKELSPIKDFRSSLTIRKLLKTINPTIIHLHSSKAGVLGRFANTLLLNHQKKAYYTPHGYSFLRQDISGVKRELYKLIEKYTQLFFGGTTIACGDTEHAISKGFGQSILVRNGIDIDNIEQYYQPCQNKRLTIGIVGRITFARNPKLFNQIALKFSNYDFVWIGDGEDRHLLTAPNIKITGWFTDNTQVFPLLNQLDVYLQTSLWEGLPLALLEAMALKKPIVATNIIGNKDIVNNGINGYLFDNIEQLDTIFEQLSFAENREKLGKNAYKNCVEKFDYRKNFKLLEEIFINTNR